MHAKLSLSLLNNNLPLTPKKTTLMEFTKKETVLKELGILSADGYVVGPYFSMREHSYMFSYDPTTQLFFSPRIEIYDQGVSCRYPYTFADKLIYIDNNYHDKFFDIEHEIGITINIKALDDKLYLFTYLGNDKWLYGII